MEEQDDLANVAAEGTQGLEDKMDLPTQDGLAEEQPTTPQGLGAESATPNGSDDECLAQYFALMKGENSSGETSPLAACPFII